MFNSCPGSEPSLYLLCPNGSTNNTENCDNLDKYFVLLRIDCYIKSVFYPLTAILILIGTILNLFSFYCFIKMNKRNSQNIYLSVLSLGDTINLHINFTLPLLRQNENFDDIFRNLDTLCPLSGVFAEFFLIFPTWIVVLLTLERLICIILPSKRRSSFTQKRAKYSIVILAIIVLALSIYRLYDLKGIDQLSVFSVVTCNGEHRPIDHIRNFNLIIWTILPECITLILSLVIIYEIKLAKQQFEADHSNARQIRYNQATKTVLLISILFLVFHTPTGIMIALNYGTEEKTLGVIIILVSRKVTVILYEISLCSKFFIYNQTFKNFKGILLASISRFSHRNNSAKLGRPAINNSHDGRTDRKIHFAHIKHSITSPTSQSETLIKNPEENHNILTNCHRRTSSISIARSNQEPQPLMVIMAKTTDGIHVTVEKTPNLLRRYTLENRRPL